MKQFGDYNPTLYGLDYGYGLCQAEAYALSAALYGVRRQ